jgi:hypothetical protein
MEQCKLLVEKLVVCDIPGNTERSGAAAGLSVYSTEVRGLYLTSYIDCLRFLQLFTFSLIYKDCESFI